MKEVKAIQIESVRPSVDGGRYPAKGIVGEKCVVTADIFRDGHEGIKAVVKWKKKGDAAFQEVLMTALPNDAWRGEFLLSENGMYVFTIEAWTNREGGANIREDAVRYPLEFQIFADRPAALAGAWYEFFIRSATRDLNTPGTFKTAEHRLREIKEMGFDVVYLPPVHPIGFTARKGRNGTLGAGPSDPGSPWAIGNETGGHTAIDAALGTLADFDHFVQTANVLGLEVALDFAVQCSPDHPWIKQHPEWFFHKPDGSIKCAENPPHKYEDIVWVNFENPEWKALWAELLSVVLFWVSHGVKIFRVDNPHTKPLPFWEWLISDVKAKHPEVLFLAEAFTRPKMMKALSKAGFSQSYTYFTWRNTRVELTEYIKELTKSGMEDYFRPNFFVNTPDNLNEYLQKGGRAAFKTRLVLAATLSPSYGMYSGYELCENETIPGTEQYFNSEIFEVKARDWNRPGNIVDFVTRINGIRKNNPALRQLANTKFMQTDNGQILFYCKATPDRSNVIFVLVNLDPFNAHHGTAWIPLEEIGVKAGGNYEVTDLITGISYTWGDKNYVRLDPIAEPAHILRVERHF